MIREAKVSDIDAVLALGIECHRKAATRYTVAPAKARQMIAHFIQSQSRFSMVKESNGELLGVLLGGIEPVWYSDTDKEGSDLLFYVRQDPRSVGAGTMLLKRFIRWGYAKGAAGFAMAVSFGGAEAVDTGKIYVKQGFTQVGGMFYLQDKLREKRV